MFCRRCGETNQVCHGCILPFSGVLRHFLNKTHGKKHAEKTGSSVDTSASSSCGFKRYQQASQFKLAQAKKQAAERAKTIGAARAFISKMLFSSCVIHMLKDSEHTA